MNRVNRLLTALQTALAPVVTAGLAKGVVDADADFGDTASGRGGKFDLPLLGVAYAGDKNAGPLGTDRIRQRAAAGFVVFILVSDRAGTPATQRTINELVDAVIDAAAGIAPTEGGDVLGAPWAYAGSSPEPLGSESERLGLRLWAVTFVCEHAFVPATAGAAADSLEGLDGEMDARPGKTPASESDDLMEFTTDV